MKNELGLKLIKKFSLDTKLLRFSRQQKLAKELSALQGGLENEKMLYKKHIAGKIENILYALLAMLILLFILWINPQENILQDGNLVVREGYEGIEKSLKLVAKSEGMEEEVEVLIEPLRYSKSQLDVFANEVFGRIPWEYFFSEKVTGEGVYVIKQHINLPAKIDSYPFELSMESSDYEVMNNHGTITMDSYETAQEILLTVTLSCYEYIWEKEYRVLVHKPAMQWDIGFSERVSEVIEELDQEFSENKELILPMEIDGHQIVYEEKGDSSLLVVMGLGIVVLVLLWLLPDNTLVKQTEEKRRQLLIDYAKLVGKLTLYMGAGLSLRSTIHKIIGTADKNRFYTKELEIVMREVENGIPENTAINKMADRCKVPCYTKLAVLLNQNIRKGNNNLQRQLNEEMDKAFEERKNMARKYAEEAATKLLLPMILMLLVVIVMIMYPAFVSFTI